ncbi:MAG TPA: hypothetical protein VJ789_02980 [Burkholderiales bacterium]|nr:hypothetical protein [Burkholderiales bacterium]
MTVQPLLADGEWTAGRGAPLTVMDKYALAPGAQVGTADQAQAGQAVAAAS